MRVIGFTGAAHTYPGHADALTEAGAETDDPPLGGFQAACSAALSEWSEDCLKRLATLGLLRRAFVEADKDLHVLVAPAAGWSRWDR